MLPSARVGGRALRLAARQRQRGVGVGGVLLHWGIRAIPLGIAALLLGYVLKSAGAGPAEAGLPGPRVSVFGTIHPDIFRLGAPLGSGSPTRRRNPLFPEPRRARRLQSKMMAAPRSTTSARVPFIFPAAGGSRRIPASAPIWTIRTM